MTSYILSSLLLVLSHLNLNKEPMNEFELPNIWTKDFKITYSYRGSMSGSRTELTISYDSCNYTIQSGMKAPKTGVFAMTEAKRTAILKKMHELKVNTIKSEISIAPVNDGWSQLICFGHNCVQGGTSAIMSDRDKDIFSDACAYIADFAVKNSKKSN